MNDSDPTGLVPSSNGCGSPSDRYSKHAPNLWFRLACDAHDIDYGTCGMTKADADDRFRRNMHDLCARRYPIPTTGLAPLCHAFAELYYGIVAGAGDHAYSEAQKAEGCLPPVEIGVCK